VLLVLPLDVAIEAQVKSIFVQAKDAYGREDVVYNNAAFLSLINRARVLVETNSGVL